MKYKKTIPRSAFPERLFEFAFNAAFIDRNAAILVGTPDIPSAVEAGIPGMDARLWFGLFTTAKTPRAVVMKLNQEITEVLNRSDVKQMLITQGAEAAPSTPEELGDFVKSELARWTPIIKAAGIKAN